MQGRGDNRIRRVLFVGRRGVVRTAFAQALTTRLGQGRWQAWTAAWEPAGAGDPFAAVLMRRSGLTPDPLPPRAVARHFGPDAPVFDYVITVVAGAPALAFTGLNGDPVFSHWSVPDPVAISGALTGQETALAYGRAFEQMARRVSALMALPLPSLDRLEAAWAIRNLDRVESLDCRAA